MPQFAILLFEIEQVEGSIDHQQEDIRIDWFLKEIIRSKPNGADGILSFLTTSDDYFGAGFKAKYGFNQCEPFRGLIGQWRQAQVEDNHPGSLSSKSGQR